MYYSVLGIVGTGPLGGDLPIKHIASVLLAASNRVCAAANFASPVQRCSL